MTNSVAPLQGRHALVAGASQGIGFGIAAAMLAAGARVTLGGRDGTRLASAARRLEGGERVSVVAGDFSDAAFVREALPALGGVDVLVASYGDTDTPPGYDSSDEAWERLVRGNLAGPAMVAREVGRAMQANRRGTILFIGSICGHEVLGAPIAYNAGKAGLRAVMKTMSRELGQFGVRVNMISPGNILFEGGRWSQKLEQDRPAVETLIKRVTPLGRFGTPEDVAEAAVFLCSDKASFITGIDLVVDGGQTASI